MIHTLPMFPLKMVVFPNEFVPLHIFEERYQQLVEDCERDKTTFGIPTYIDNKIEYGTEVSLFQVVERYDDGTCDIICKGERFFKIETFHKVLVDKLYAGAEVSFLDRDDTSDETKQTVLMRLVEEFYDAMELPKPTIRKPTFTSYTLAHKLGLSIEEEYYLVKIPSEVNRLEYLIQHLSRTIPVIRNITRTKQIIEMNGHFKNFDPLDFKDLKVE